MFHYLLILGSLIFTLPSFANALPAQVIIIRHAEKLNNGLNLSLKGQERAAVLVPYFQNTPEFTRYGPPVAIYSTAAPKETSSKAAIQTVQGLSDVLKIPLSSKFEMDDYRAMVEEIRTNPTYTGKLVLICWEHYVIPEIARALGVFQTPARWPVEIFDRVWVITYQPGGKPVFQNLPQRLLFGDTQS